MDKKDLSKMPKEELMRELEKFHAAHNRSALGRDETDPQQLLRELEAHQIELEVQNRELLQFQHELVESESRYVDL
jgi:hypothetical protein